MDRIDKRQLEISKQDEYVANFGTMNSVKQLSLPKRVAHTFINGLKVNLGMVWELEEYSIVYFCSLLNYTYNDERIRSKKLHLDIARIAYHEFRNNTKYDIDWSDLYSIQSSHKTTDNPFVSFATYFCVDKGRTEKEVLKEITPILESINKKFKEQQSSMITIHNSVIKTHQNGHLGLRRVDHKNEIKKISELILQGKKKTEIVELLGLTEKEYRNIYAYSIRNNYKFPKYKESNNENNITEEFDEESFQYAGYSLNDDLVNSVSELREKKYTIYQISDELGVSKSRVFAVISFINDGRIKNPILRDKQKEKNSKIEKYLNSGMKPSKIAEKMELSIVTIYKLLTVIKPDYVLKKKQARIRRYNKYLNAGMSYKLIAAKESVTEKAVIMFIHQNMSKRKSLHKIKSETILKEIMNYVDNGWTAIQIAKQRGIKSRSVLMYAKKHGFYKQLVENKRLFIEKNKKQ